MQQYETVAARAQRTGRAPRLIRRDAAEGRIPGAVRIGGLRSPWALPLEGVNDNTPAPKGAAGVSRTQTGSTGQWPDVTSSGEPVDVIGTARRVAGRVGVVHTLPARALADLAFSVAAVAARHGIDRDGACAACGWTYPCPDRLALDAALRGAYDTVTLGGAA